ncbi:MAG: anti-sigma factor family protein [Blastocatellia bacterium]
MNCRDFETIIIEIARDRLMDAAARERGLGHVQQCARCATLLVEERALSRDLRGLSAGCDAEEIPARIETALVAAFRQRAAAPIVAPRRRRWLPAVAALALLTFGLSLAGWIASSSRQESPMVDSTNGAAPPTNIPATPVVADRTPPLIVDVRQPDRLIPGPTPEKRRKRLALASANRRSASDDAPREFVTEFFPVMQGGELIPLEGGQIVRVRMLRSNLIPLGIPFNQERASETIQADVLVSNDGLARAVRLVY